jgi:hypothetical protein
MRAHFSEVEVACWFCWRPDSLVDALSLSKEAVRHMVRSQRQYLVLVAIYCFAPCSIDLEGRSQNKYWGLLSLNMRLTSRACDGELTEPSDELADLKFVERMASCLTWLREAVVRCCSSFEGLELEVCFLAQGNI